MTGKMAAAKPGVIGTSTGTVKSAPAGKNLVLKTANPT